MPYPHPTKVFAVKTAKLYKVTADIGGTATTYAAGIVVPSFRQIAVTETWKEAYLRGDNALQDYESMRETVKLSINHGKLQPDIVAVLTGATVADSGTTPNQKVTTTYAQADVPGFWKLDAQCFSIDGSGGDYHIVAGKCKIGGNRPFGMTEEDFQDYQFEAVSIAPVGTGSVWYQETIEETAAAPA